MNTASSFPSIGVRELATTVSRGIGGVFTTHVSTTAAAAATAAEGQSPAGGGAASGGSNTTGRGPSSTTGGGGGEGLSWSASPIAAGSPPVSRELASAGEESPQTSWGRAAGDGGAGWQQQQRDHHSSPAGSGSMSFLLADAGEAEDGACRSCQR